MNDVVEQINKEDYIVSYYTMFTETHDGNISVFNTMTGKLLEISGDLKELFDYTIENLSDKNELRDRLIEEDFIVNALKDEKKALDKLEDDILKRKEELFIVLLPTENCNCRCVYCCQSFEKGNMSESTEKEIIEYVRRNLSKYKRLRIEWFGGEPLLNYNSIERISFELIKICDEHKVLYTSVITTNGTLLTLDMYNKLKKLRITGYQITLDGTKEIHNSLRKGLECADTWQATVENLKVIRDNVKTSALSIMIRTNVTKDIYDNLSDFLDIIKKEFGNDHRFRIYIRLAGDWGKMIDREVKNNFCDTSQYYDILDMLSEYKLKSTLHSSFLKPGGHVCHAARDNSFLVGAEGAVRKCTCLLDDESIEDINLLGYIGDNKDTYYSEFWDHSKYQIPDKCYVCKLAPLCFGRTCPVKMNKECPYDLKEFIRILAILPRISLETKSIGIEEMPLYNVSNRLSVIYDKYGILESNLPFFKVNEEAVEKLDSLEYISLLVEIENEFGVEVPDEDLLNDSIFNIQFIYQLQELINTY